jgi:diaminopimelate epimerase
MKIPFTKAHGARNDFLLTWRADAPADGHPAIAVAICDRHTGVGADGWMLVDPPGDAEADGSIHLYNSDGSVAEISGNGTRCAAALLIQHGYAGDVVRVRTGAGVKTIRVLERRGLHFDFEMNMGRPEVRELRHQLRLRAGEREGVVMWLGNPQCALLVSDLDFDWRALGVEIEHHPDFPNRTNVSFVKAVDRHTIDVRFWERGAGETMSSGTGSTGAVAAALAHGLVDSPVEVRTPAGPIRLRIEGDYLLTGPAEIVVEGAFHYNRD